MAAVTGRRYRVLTRHESRVSSPHEALSARAASRFPAFSRPPVAARFGLLGSFCRAGGDLLRGGGLARAERLEPIPQSHRSARRIAGSPAYIPKPVPDDQNFCATPFLKSLFQSNFNGNILTNDLCYARAPTILATTVQKARRTGHRHFTDLVAWQQACRGDAKRHIEDSGSHLNDQHQPRGAGGGGAGGSGRNETRRGGVCGTSRRQHPAVFAFVRWFMIWKILGQFWAALGRCESALPAPEIGSVRGTGGGADRPCPGRCETEPFPGTTPSNRSRI